MLKARAEDKNGKEHILFGLSYRNLDLLREGRPIKINGEEIGLDCDILIFAEPTERDMVKHMQPFLDEHTEVKIDPKAME